MSTHTQSLHEAKVVWDELLALCVPFVTQGSYCMVEDTVLSSPLDALAAFWKFQPSKDFCSDEDREFLGLTQHRGGYLLRTGSDNKKLLDTNVTATFDREYNKLFKGGKRTYKEHKVTYARDQGEAMKKAADEGIKALGM